MAKTISQKRASMGKIEDVGVIRAIQQIYTDLNEIISAVNSSKLEIDDEEGEKTGKTGNIRVTKRPWTGTTGVESHKYAIEGRSDDGWVTTPPLHRLNRRYSIIPGEELVISSGTITVINSFHTVGTEDEASTDNLETINGRGIGQTVTLTASDDGNSIVVDDNAGNIKTAGNFTLNNIEDTITLMYNGTNWLELSRSSNGS